MVEKAKFGNLEAYTYLLVTLNLTLALIVMFFNCLCCKKRIPKNDLLGLEGMVKLKNPDEVIVVNSSNANSNATVPNAAPSSGLVHNSESQAELNASTVSNADSEKRSSTAAHRSLPDIPVAENNDNGSELYETVADKQLANAQNQSPQPSLKKQASVSQHSSISQADDVSSPYSRVKGLPHDYAKVRATEHPYAQLNAPSTSNSAVAATTSSTASSKAPCTQHGTDSLQRGSQLSGGSTQNVNDESTSQVEIPAASAIAGMISASQDLPYMTPPIANQHFSGDSQDSSKGYTSISVREPLANILAQQPPSKPATRKTTLTRDVNDSHYATVSDDSDETYAAIEDPNNRQIPNATDIYTSGSETYAQIQPMQANPIVVAVEINNSSSLSTSGSQVDANGGQLPLANHVAGSGSSHRASSSSMEHAVPVPPHVDSLRAQMHSRQASSSSSVCNLGSPKPEKRQANSPLPPTPKASLGQAQHLLHSATSSSNLTSGRSSVISVIEASGECGNDLSDVSNTSPQRKHSKSLSPSKDVEGNRNIEGMYAKVMKKHKFSSHQPEALGVSPLDSAAAALLMDTQKPNSTGLELGRVRSNSYSAKDHGYETIPADGQKLAQNPLLHENRKSDCYAANMLQKERQQQEAASNQTHHNTSSSSGVQIKHGTPSTSTSTKYYETINCPPCQPNSSSSNSGNSNSNNSNSNDPGYEQLQTAANDDDAKKSDYDPNYEVLKSRAHSDDGYAKVLEKKRPPGDVVDGSGGYSTIPGADANHNYASILETKAHLAAVAPGETDHYARIAENVSVTSPISPNSSSMANSLSMITVTTSTSIVSSMSSQQTPHSSQYESLTGTGSETDPNYESVCYLNATTTTTTTSVATTTNNSSNNSNSNSSSSSNSNTDHAYERLESENNTQANSPLSTELSTPSEQQLVVDDYFQV